ncbi:virulent strain associated lipoprotein [Reticulomyxa filosa]|uniref:Virulent strain associated lipoprotein n=1 Tax=Reticulomyxa filosa TaxID=46433 RepID=X6NN15_RETFI|nr:virulent strain associated lipoprotein [Reticulomyxa filosa]|eukprot:ETO27099.1 virulent strain associated lipoprotein [Reticulomyxa filosa]
MEMSTVNQSKNLNNKIWLMQPPLSSRTTRSMPENEHPFADVTTKEIKEMRDKILEQNELRKDREKKVEARKVNVFTKHINTFVIGIIKKQIDGRYECKKLEETSRFLAEKQKKAELEYKQKVSQREKENKAKKQRHIHELEEKQQLLEMKKKEKLEEMEQKKKFWERSKRKRWKKHTKNRQDNSEYKKKKNKKKELQARQKIEKKKEEERIEKLRQERIAKSLSLQKKLQVREQRAKEIREQQEDSLLDNGQKLVEHMNKNEIRRKDFEQKLIMHLRERRENAYKKRLIVLSRKEQKLLEEESKSMSLVEESIKSINKRIDNVKNRRRKLKEKLRQEIENKLQSAKKRKEEIELEKENEIGQKKSELEKKFKKAEAVLSFKSNMVQLSRDHVAEQLLRKQEFSELLEKLARSQDGFEKLLKLGLDFENPDPEKFSPGYLLQKLQQVNSPDLLEEK